MLNCNVAREALDNLDDFARMAGITPTGPTSVLVAFINDVETLLKHNSIKQTPALFKEKK